MVFNNSNLIEDGVIKKIRSFIILLLIIFSIIQIYIANFKLLDIILVFMIFFSTTYCVLKIFTSENLKKFFLPCIIIFSLNITHLSGALIFKTILGQSLSSNLFFPIKTFLFCTIYQLVIIFTFNFYCRSSKLKNISDLISNKLVDKLNGFTIPSINFSYFLFFILILLKYYLDIIDQGLDAFTTYGNIYMKILYGLREFYYLPLFIFFYYFQTNQLSKNKLSIILIFYIFIGVYFGFASNSRTQVFNSFLYLSFCYIFFKILFYKINKNFINIPIIIISIFFIINANFINDIMLQNRGIRDDIKSTELFKMTFETKQLETNIIKQQDDFAYTENHMFDRLVIIKFLDRSLFISNNFSKQQKKEFTNSALIKLVLILPQNIITIFNKEFNKKKYYISTGSLIDRIDNGYDKGGLFNSGHILAELYIILDSYFLLILLIFLLYLFIFTLFNSLQIKKDNKIIFSPIIIVFLLTLIFTGGADSIMGLISTIVRSFLQTLILYFFIICFYLKFFKQI